MFQIKFACAQTIHSFSSKKIYEFILKTVETKKIEKKTSSFVTFNIV